MTGGILVLVEVLKDTISDITFEMLGAARKIADTLNIPLYAFITGGNIETCPAQLSIADKVLLLSSPDLSFSSSETVSSAIKRVIENKQMSFYSSEKMITLLKSVVEQKQISVVMVGGTNVSSGIGSKLSRRIKFPLINFCNHLRVDNGSLIVTSQLFGGKISTDTQLPENRGIISISPGSFPPDEGKVEKSPTIEKIEFASEKPKVVFKEFIEPEAGDVDITKQDVLISIGRGIQDKNNVELAEELANLIGGVVSASRPVIDQGWLPLSRQVGKSGMTVNPKLYLALGISGAPEHVEGMKNSQLIVAINSDSKAPIFDISHYGINTDLFEILPALIEKIKERKNASTG